MGGHGGNPFQGVEVLLLFSIFGLVVYFGLFGDVSHSLLGERRADDISSEVFHGLFIARLDPGATNTLKPAFAITVHKSQGSEYGQVLLVLPDDSENRLLTREIIYKGLTRAKYLAVIYGKKDALKRAVEQRIARESGINIWNEA